MKRDHNRTLRHVARRLEDAGAFEGIAVDPARFARDLRVQPPRKHYTVMFTPRSGSSWLTDLLASTDALGNPGEMFNPAFMPKIARFINAGSMRQYAQMITRRNQSPAGIFGVEVVHDHLARAFPDEKNFAALFPRDMQWFFLIRKDIVAQAVSLAKAIQTQVFHSTETSPEDREAADAQATYDPVLIERQLNRLRNMERRTGDMFWRMRIDPHRISYEWMMQHGPRAVVRLFASKLGEPLPRVPRDLRHTKIATSKNADFAARFREERAGLVADIEHDRAPLLADLRRQRASDNRLLAFLDRTRTRVGRIDRLSR